MAQAAAKAKAEPPFTPGQIAIARDYRSLTERYHSSGVKGSSLETVSESGSGGGSYMDAVIRDHLRLATFHRRIGDGVAMEVRRVRPSKRGGVKRRAIRDRALVDMVCLQDATLKDVLKAHGWSINRQQIDAVLRALRSALDRMQGPVRRQRNRTHRFIGEL